MKTAILTILFLFLSFVVNGQEIEADTALASQQYQEAYKGLKNRKFQHLDSFVVTFTKTAEVFKHHNMWNRYLDAKCSLLECYARKSMLSETHNLAQEIINAAYQNSDTPKAYTGVTWHNIGLCYHYLGNYDSALVNYEKGLAARIAFFGENHQEVASSYNNIGVIYDYKSDYDKALKYYLNALNTNLALFGEKHVDVANSYNNIGLAYEWKLSYDEVLEYHLKALEIRKELFGEEHVDVAASYNNIGNVYALKYEDEKALEYHLKALEIEKELFGEKHVDLATSYNNIGNVYLDKVEYDIALEYYMKSLKMRKKLLGKEHYDVAASYNNIGVVYQNKSEYNIAMEYYSKGLKIERELFGEEHFDVANTYNNMGIAYLDISEYEKALKYYLKCLEIRKKLLGEKNFYVVNSYNNIGGVYSAKGEYDLALVYFQKALCANLLDFDDCSNVTINPIIQNYLDYDGLMTSLLGKAGIFTDVANFSASGSRTANLKLALKQYQMCDTVIAQSRQIATLKSDKIGFGETANEEAIYKEAIGICLSLSKRDSMYAASTSYGYEELAFYFSERNKASVLQSSITQANALKFSGLPDSLVLQEKSLQKDIFLYEQMLAKQPDSSEQILFQSKLFDANRSYENLLTKLEIDYPRYHQLKQTRKSLTVKEIQQKLTLKTAIVEHLITDSILYVFTITKKSFDVHAVPITEKFHKYPTALRMGILYKNDDLYTLMSHKLYKKLFPKALPKNIENLVIIPDGNLTSIPFEVLLTKETIAKEGMDFKNLPYLINNYNVSYAYSTALFFQSQNHMQTDKDRPQHDDLRELKEQKHLLAFAPVFADKSTGNMSIHTRDLLVKNEAMKDSTVRGNLLKGGYVTPLPATDIETQSIYKKFVSKKLKVDLYTHEKAKEETLKKEAKNYRYIHIATHGIVNSEKPELSGILFAQDSTSKEDGVLYTGEIYNLQFNADLVTLSACETGLGKVQTGEGMIGLTRALLYAGAKNMVVSLWKVADNSTSELMIDFYGNFLDDEKNPYRFSKALQKAKLNMIAEGKYAHPYFWSPFILVGR